MQLDSSCLEKELKKLMRYQNAIEMLKKIIKHIKMCNNFKELKCNPISRIYGFERLKYSLNEYHSFRLGESGVIRLIVKINEDENLIKVEFISMNHYDDFKRKLKENK